MLEAARFQICTKKERLTHTAKERRKKRQIHTKREENRDGAQMDSL